MLVLERREGETIWIGNVEVHFFNFRPGGRKIKVGINAPREIPIVRGEIKADYEQADPSQHELRSPSSSNGIQHDPARRAA